MEPVGHLEWRTARVDGRRAAYGVAGHGLPVVFLHGWGLGPKAYKRALKHLVRLGCRVYAPGLPEFGGTESLPAGWRTLADHAGWIDAFMTAVGIDEPAVVAGHSMGGAVAIRLTRDFPDRVARLVLINSIGSRVWTDDSDGPRLLDARPIWHWAVSFSEEIAGSRTAAPMLKAFAADGLGTMLRNPTGVLRAAMMARRADLSPDLVAVRESGVPVTVVTSSGDLVAPAGGFNDMCRLLGVSGRVVPGHHSWLLSAPQDFASVLAPVVQAARAAGAARAGLRPGVVTPMYGRSLAASG